MREIRQAIVGIAAILLCMGISVHSAAASTSDGSCSKPAQHAADSVVDVPDYATQADNANIAERSTEAARLWNSTIDSLSASNNPRDWALAAFINLLPRDGVDRTQTAALAARAAAAAPDDVLIQSMTLAALDASSGADTSVAAQNLQVLEPDNAAAWMNSLNTAFANKDATGVDVALEHMAAGNRFDLHYAAIASAVAEVYLRYPLAEQYRAQAQDQGWPGSDEDIALAMGSVSAAGFALPAFQNLVLACSIDPQTGKNVWRGPDCAHVGRLLAMHSNTLISKKTGFALLRVSHTYTNQDVQNARELDWLRTSWVKLFATDPADGSALAIAQMKDWIATGNEVESMRRGLVRAEYPVSPPADWVDESSSFSAKRLQDDKRSADYRAAHSH